MTLVRLGNYNVQVNVDGNSRVNADIVDNAEYNLSTNYSINPYVNGSYEGNFQTDVPGKDMQIKVGRNEVTNTDGYFYYTLYEKSGYFSISSENSGRYARWADGAASHAKFYASCHGNSDYSLYLTNVRAFSFYDSGVDVDVGTSFSTGWAPWDGSSSAIGGKQETGGDYYTIRCQARVPYEVTW